MPPSLTGETDSGNFRPRQTQAHSGRERQDADGASDDHSGNSEGIPLQTNKGSQSIAGDGNNPRETPGESREDQEREAAKRTLAETPRIVGSWKYDKLGALTCLTVCEEYAFVKGPDGLIVINIKDPRTPQLARFFGKDEVKSISCISVVGKYLYIGGSGGLQVIDISNIEKPSTVAFYETGSSIDELCVRGSYAYVVLNSADELQVIEIADGSSLRYRGSCGLEHALGISADDSHVYLAGHVRTSAAASEPYETFGVQIIDVSIPDNPTTVATCLIDKSLVKLCSDVQVQDPYAYILRGLSMVILDISEPHRPETVGEVTASRRKRLCSLWIEGPFGYVCDLTGQIAIWDISNPDRPVYVKSVDTGASWAEICVAGRYAYVLNQGSGLQIVELFEDENKTVEEDGESE
jgi:hypothetical protein